MGGCNFGSEPYLITLHDNVRLSFGVSLITHDGGNHAFIWNEKYKNKGIHSFGKIEIDENTFIGANAIIMPNVYIGKNCVIGCGAVVTRSIPDDSVAVGVPAKVIENVWDYAEKTKRYSINNWNEEEFQKNKIEYLKKTIPNPQKG